jgi:hypothetical protein
MFGSRLQSEKMELPRMNYGVPLDGSGARQAYNWAPAARFKSTEYCMDSPKTSPFGEYNIIQPTHTSFRDPRMLYDHLATTRLTIV